MPGRLFFFIEAKKYRNFERVAILSMNKTFVLSKEDYQNLKLITGRKFSHRIIPIGISDRGIKKDREEDGILNMLFLGTLTWEPNNRGIIWFLKNIMPKLNEKYKKLNLYIVGKTPSNELKNIATKFNNVVITGYVESVDEYYNKSDFMIVPLFTGSGQRVKIIEAFSKGMPVISTTLGAEGLFSTDGIDILIADTKKEFYDKIQALTKSSLRKKISINSRKLYEQYYSIQSVGKKVNNAISDVR